MAADEPEQEEDFTPVAKEQRWEQPNPDADSGVDDERTKLTIYLTSAGGPYSHYVTFELNLKKFLEALKDPRSVIVDEDPTNSRRRWIVAAHVISFDETT